MIFLSPSDVNIKVVPDHYCHDELNKIKDLKKLSSLF